MSGLLDAQLAELKKSSAFQEEQAVLEISERIYSAMQQRGMSKGELAQRLGTSPAFVSKLLRGDNNFTIKTLVSIARALDCKLLEPHFLPQEAPANCGRQMDKLAAWAWNSAHHYQASDALPPYTSSDESSGHDSSPSAA